MNGECFQIDKRRRFLPGMSAEPPALDLNMHSVSNWVARLKIVDHWDREAPTLELP